MYRYLSQLVVYKNLAKDDLLSCLADCFKRFEEGNQSKDSLVSDIYTQINALLDVATHYGFNENLWHNYLALLLAMTENPFSLCCEKKGAQEGSVNILARNDCRMIKALFDFDFGAIEHALGISCFSLICDYQALEKDVKTYNRQVSEKVRQLSKAIDQAHDNNAVFDVITSFYRDYGVGKLGLNHAFRLSGTGDSLVIEPITNTIDVHLDDLIGYESQKRIIISNTESFLEGKRANNLLLHGDSGTGKSTCIKAILNMYASQGLRIIEIYRHQFVDLSQLIAAIKNRNYRFIIYMDDLSFEEYETDFKYLKAVIEGSIEMSPDNVLIYATSNRRHLIKETWKDREDQGGGDDIHHSDTAEEKISLVNRFGITVYFPKPTEQEYLDIVVGIARKHPEINMTDDMLKHEAKKWGLWHGNISGRRAQQFIHYLLGQIS
jgi:uncharacterized protein